MPNLSDLTAAGNLKYVQIALSAAPGTDSPTWPANAWFKLPFNAKFADPYNICTLNTSLSTITLPAGLYQLNICVQAENITGAAVRDYITRLRVNNTQTAAKWPISTAAHTDNNTVPGGTLFAPTAFYLNTTGFISLEQYWNAAVAWDSTIDDGESNIFYRMDIWKLR